MYDTITLKGQGNFKNIDLQLGVSECRMYHNALLESNSQFELFNLIQFNSVLSNPIQMNMIN